MNTLKCAECADTKRQLELQVFPIAFSAIAFSALTLLVGWQEGHPACKKTEWWDVGMVVWDEVQTCI